VLRSFVPFSETLPSLYDEWRRLIVAHGVSGKKTHDARLVAAMTVHHITQLLTFNSDDFSRYASITVLHPASVVLSPSDSPKQG
jgi:predicted nucleic acid-binding protein